MTEAFKREEKDVHAQLETVKEKENKEIEARKAKFVHTLETEEVEIKRLDSEDVEECTKVMKRCGFEVEEPEVANIVIFGNSFAATVDRLIVGIGLSWSAHLDLATKTMTADKPNALYMEDSAVLLAYEGRGIRRILVQEREKEAKLRGFIYSMAFLSEDAPKEHVAEYISEAGNAMEKLYLSEGYEFYRTEQGILAVKRLNPDPEQDSEDETKNKTSPGKGKDEKKKFFE